MQRKQILELSFQQDYEALVSLSPETKKELVWWIQNLRLNNGRCLTDASLQGWRAYCRGQGTGGQWSSKEKQFHTNILELKAAKLAILSVHHMFPETSSVHL